MLQRCGQILPKAPIVSLSPLKYSEQFFKGVLARSSTVKLAKECNGICLAPAPKYQLEAMMTDIFGRPLKMIPVPQELFGQPLRIDLLQRVVEWERQGIRGLSNPVKVRSEVRGSGRKPFNQKGTGRARMGSIRSPINRGGGIVHGPKKRSFALDIPKKLRRLALKVMLSTKFQEGKVLFWDNAQLDDYHSKRFKDVVNGAATDSMLIIDPAPTDRNIRLSSRKYPYVTIRRPARLFITEVMRRGTLVITQEGMHHLELWLSSSRELRAQWKDSVNMRTHRARKLKQYMKKQEVIRRKRALVLERARKQLSSSSSS